MLIRHLVFVGLRQQPFFFSNWVNYAVYQETPFDWRKIQDDASAFGYL